MRAGQTDRRNRWHAGTVTRYGFSTGTQTFVGPDSAWRTTALRVEPGTYLVRRLAPSSRFYIGQGHTAPTWGGSYVSLSESIVTLDATVTVSQPWLYVYTSNANEDISLWIERIA
ncbi:hypothetical protein [Flaviflexus equikiangi]|uniref:Uncharacterized protein n=1 Tax=Flaviflexus equikiangi TaxID=2758573 RepID=A0ABS2TCF4_9ACTO|nr:hypothetical protein [Flaviflexus equikiangi]MBM9432323.1 hypothetical protein [Flaviflexus equikiangi]